MCVLLLFLFLFLFLLFFVCLGMRIIRVTQRTSRAALGTVIMTLFVFFRLACVTVRAARPICVARISEVAGSILRSRVFVFLRRFFFLVILFVAFVSLFVLAADTLGIVR